MERQSDIYSKIADISNLISNISIYLWISEIIWDIRNYLEISEIEIVI